MGVIASKWSSPYRPVSLTQVWLRPIARTAEMAAASNRRLGLCPLPKSSRSPARKIGSAEISSKIGNMLPVTWLRSSDAAPNPVNTPRPPSRDVGLLCAA